MRLRLDTAFFLTVVILCCCTAFENDLTYLKAFDDSIIYRLAWENEQENLLKNEEMEALETITMTTARKEKYVCALPKMQKPKQVIICICLEVMTAKSAQYISRSEETQIYNNYG